MIYRNLLFFVGLFFCVASSFLSSDQAFDQEYDETLIALIESGEALDEELFQDEEHSFATETIAIKEPYRIGIGDSFSISIFGEKNTERNVTVDFTGSIYYRLNEPLFVLGKTIEEVRALINSHIHRLFPFKSVTITPHQFAGRFYTILGEVVQPGKKILQGKTTVMTALCAAGGFRTGAFRAQTIDMQDLNHTFLARKGDYVPIDFTKLVNDGDLSQDVELESGDYLFVPSALSREIYVLGEVNTPTTIGYVHAISLVEALCEARGMAPRASSRIIVIRGSLVNPIQFQIDIRRILRGTEPNFILQPGDIVFVPVRHFQSFREVLQSGIRAFVSAASEFAGAKYFTEVVTKAAARNQVSDDDSSSAAAETVDNAAIINQINNAIVATTRTAESTTPNR